MLMNKVLTNKDREERLLESEIRLMNKCEFGFLIMYLNLVLDENCKSITTDGENILIKPMFLDSLSNQELDFVLMHEILHLVLGHGVYSKEMDDELFDRACDIKVNSILFKFFKGNTKCITVNGEVCEHEVNGKEGYNYTEKEIYDMLKKQYDNSRENIKRRILGSVFEIPKYDYSNNGKKLWDSHVELRRMANDELLQEDWYNRLLEACDMENTEKSFLKAGLKSCLNERLIEKTQKSQKAWKEILNDFIQEDVKDYSFSPPDKRYSDEDLFLPDYNDKDEMVENILFMIDTSGSMSDEDITNSYFEVKGAIDQFNGKLKGWLGFFDASVVEPKPFSNEEEFEIIHPKGGGGTDFGVIFKFVQKNMADNLPSGIIIFTDGYADFPSQSEAMGIPVLWLINNNDVEPEWGKVARMITKK